MAWNQAAFDAEMAEKYRQSGVTTAANAALARAQADAALSNARSNAESAAAAAQLDRNRAAWVGPTAQQDIDSKQVYDRNSTNATNANVRATDASTDNQLIQNKYADQEAQNRLKLQEIDINAKPGLYKSEEGLNRSQGGYYDRGNLDPKVSPPADRRSDATNPNAEPTKSVVMTPMPGSPTSLLAGLLQPQNRPNYGAGAPATMAPMPSLVPNSVVAGAPPSEQPVNRTGGMLANSLFTPAPRRRPSLLAMGTEGGLLDSNFLNNRLTLKRGTARVPGKGSGDKVPAMLEPGEAVLNKHAAGMIGRDKIAKANAKGNAQRQKEHVGKVAQMLKQLGMM